MVPSLDQLSPELSAAVTALNDSAAVPSARVLSEMAERYDNAYVRFALAYSLQHRNALQRLPLCAETEARLVRMAAESLEEQRRIEAADSMPFEIYRQSYLSRERLGV